MTGWLMAAALTGALDAGTSCAAFQRGYREANPMLPTSCLGVSSIKAGVTVGAGLAVWRLSKRHSTAARWLTVALIAVPTYATIHNLRVMGGVR